MPSEFQFSPQNGELKAFQKVDVHVVFTPLTCRRVRSVIQCDVLGNQPRLKLGNSCYNLYVFIIIYACYSASDFTIFLAYPSFLYRIKHGLYECFEWLRKTTHFIPIAYRFIFKKIFKIDRLKMP